MKHELDIRDVVRLQRRPISDDAVWHGRFQAPGGHEIQARLNWRLYAEVMAARPGNWRAA